MKTIWVFLGWVGLFLLCTSVSLAQETRIVHYDAGANMSTHRPSFKKAVIAIDFGGSAAVTARALFMKLGARDFAVGSNPCFAYQTVVCVRVTKGSPEQVSYSGQSGSYGGRGGYSGGGSFDGQVYPINLVVFLVAYDANDGGRRPTILLGEASSRAAAGSGSEFSSSYGRGGGGTYESNSTNGLDSSIGVAVDQDMNALLLKGSLKHLLSKFLALGTYAKWLPGAGTTVKNAF